jgi:hypothetical protein
VAKSPEASKRSVLADAMSDMTVFLFPKGKRRKNALTLVEELIRKSVLNLGPVLWYNRYVTKSNE